MINDFFGFVWPENRIITIKILLIGGEESAYIRAEAEDGFVEGKGGWTEYNYLWFVGFKNSKLLGLGGQYYMDAVFDYRADGTVGELKTR